MLKKILSFESLGILATPVNTTKEFNRYNVIYGWNGSGKTTFGKTLRCLQTKLPPADFPDAKFKMEFYDGKKVTAANLTEAPNVQVFNVDFVSENLNLFEASTKAIIFLSKEKIEEKKEFDLKQQQFNTLVEKSNTLNKRREEIINQIDQTHQDIGREIKNFLLTTIYANVTYNKATSKGTIWPRLNQENCSEYIISDERLSDEKTFTLINSSKEAITLSDMPAEINESAILSLFNAVNQLIGTHLVSNAIKKLTENTKLSNWVKEGLEFHRTDKKSSCEFCGQQLSHERLEELEKHFDKQFEELSSNIEKHIGILKKGLRLEIPNKTSLIYETLKAEYQQLLTTATAALEIVNASIAQAIELLEKKAANPFSSIDLKATIDVDNLSTYNRSITGIAECIKQHNKLSENHQQIATQAKINIENHFCATHAQKVSLFDLSIELKSITDQVTDALAELKQIQDRMNFLQGELKNDNIALGEINQNLHMFLGRNDISLTRQKEGGYQLIRADQPAKNLSEGEKTAISLIYFFTKLNENDMKIGDQIVVIDDPISSFDSNHLFNASSFIKKHTAKAKQLIILSHNFWFFKQVRDWMLKMNKKDEDLACVYSLQRGSLKNAEATLIRFNSEYQFLFNSVLEFQELEVIDGNLYFSVANSVRRLLEGFSNFKTPDNSGFNGALQLGITKGLDESQKERIFYFVNKYSHLDRIESFDMTIETLFDEGKNVVEDVLHLIKKTDEDHYKSMLRICNKQDKLN